MTSPPDDTPRVELILHQTDDGRTRVIAVTPRARRAERAHERAAARDPLLAPDHRPRRAHAPT